MTPLYRTLTKYSANSTAMKGVLEKASSSRLQLSNVVPSFDSVLTAELFTTLTKDLFIVCQTVPDCERLYDDLVKLLGEEKMTLFAKVEHQSQIAKALHKNSVDTQNIGQLLEAIEKISIAEEPMIVIAQADCLALQLPDPNAFKKQTLTIRRDEEVGFDLLQDWLKSHWFEHKSFVDSCGDYAVRGGIIDVFPFTETVPYRIEFFGDTIESIREFDLISQRSITHREELVLIPNALDSETTATQSSIFDYLAEDALTIVYEPGQIEKHLEERHEEKAIAKLHERTQIAYTNFPIEGFEEIDFGIKRQPNFQANLKLIRAEIENLLSKGITVVISAEAKDHVARVEDLLSGDEKSDYEVDDQLADTDDLPQVDSSRGTLRYIVPSLASGFILPPESKTVIFTEHELFGRRQERGAASRKRSSRSKGISLRELRALKRGDLLVHEDKGIGKFMGLDTIEIQGARQEVVRLQYRDNDVLFVNLDFIAKLSKYSAVEVDAESVKLSKLGSAEWARTKAKTKKRLKDIARDLIAIYARRKKQLGFKFSEDDVIQKEMEAAFLYEDTPDQARAVSEVKHDMETGAPMDRLVCGDVGYGKTEVAMRAAMKAAIDKKQVAVLVPTTILAEQHERSFSDRLERFGVNVDSISRFKSTKEQKEIIAKLGEGKIDVLIGTHRLLSKDVGFKDLGLLIIDEEHRFGVAAKEKLRSLRATVDTLTLTATPIPRTLNFSLLGARDLSVIETPPKNRLPIITEILTELESETIRKAIAREMERGGQLYCIHDKVLDIELFSAKLKQLAPKARVGIIHGQMPATLIEKGMRDFLERRIDILVATKIVESGLDVPNANTIIINRAQNYGLAELYQLRGRVGRSNEQAYCFLVTPPVKQLSKDALRRLEAMEEFSELGAGFQLAMRDLEIRGAGNLLGAEQSGFINEIGFELYQKTLAEAVEELKEEEFSDLFKDVPSTTKSNPFIRKFAADDSDMVKIVLGVDALIPEHYIEDDAERFSFYQRFAKLTTQDELTELTKELKDRFGPIPEEVDNLCHIAAIRSQAMKLGLKGLSVDDASRSLRIILPDEDQKDYYQQFFPRILDSFKTLGEDRVRLTPDGKKLRLLVRLNTKERNRNRLMEILEILGAIVEATTK